MDVTVEVERADSPDAVALVTELDADLDGPYPPHSKHGYSVEKLLARDVTFLVLRVDGQAAGCGGIEVTDSGYGELKRMYVRPPFRSLGLGLHLLEHLEQHARAAGVPLLRLETGIHQHAAIRMYERHGFHRIGPFGEYWDDPNSLFLEKAVAPDAGAR